MIQPLSDIDPDLEDIITEDDTPVDNIASEKQQRLLTEPLYSSWEKPGGQQPFLAAANVGVFLEPRTPPIVPDMFLSLGVTAAKDWWRKEHRSYFIWEFGKPPDIAVEIVSNAVGGEDTEKRWKYAWMRIPWYVIYDPQQRVMAEELTVYQLRDLHYERLNTAWFPDLALGLTLWEGEFEGRTDRWLRWTDARGTVIPTGKERAEKEQQRAEEAARQAEQERQRAEQAIQQAERERQRTERLTQLLRQAGIDPDSIA
jgi:Uma2 family endonuclease